MSDFTSTLIGYQYYMQDEGGLFGDLVLPDDIDKNIVIDIIMKECGEMQPVWTNPYYMKNMINAWGQRWYPTFARWINALSIEYDPLENYDRNEDWTDTTNSKVISDATTASSRSSFDSNTMQPYDTVDYDNTDTVSGGNKHTGRIHGNIGVTTSQQMLQAELDIAQWNIYEHIKDIFMQEFCIMIY